MSAVDQNFVQTVGLILFALFIPKSRLALGAHCRILPPFGRQATFFPLPSHAGLCAARRPIFHVSRRAWRETEPTEAPCPGRHVPSPRRERIAKPATPRPVLRPLGKAQGAGSSTVSAGGTAHARGAWGSERVDRRTAAGWAADCGHTVGFWCCSVVEPLFFHAIAFCGERH